MLAMVTQPRRWSARLKPTSLVRTVVVGLGLSLAAPAQAHVDLVGSNPPHGGVLTEPPSEVRLFFSGEVRVTSLRLVAPGGRSIVLRRVGGNAPSTDVLAVPAAAVTPGDWTIEWRSIAPDGHLMRGEVAFRVEAARAR
jgi:methionine-rich copper-binding protein CopC